MQYSSLKNFTDQDADKVLDYMGAAVRLSVSKTALRIAKEVVDQTLLSGECSTTHKSFSRITGTCRRSTDRAIKTLLLAQLVTRTGKTDGGHHIYQPCWERGEEYRRWSKQFDAQWEEARKARRLQRFVAPPYPTPAAEVSREEN